MKKIFIAIILFAILLLLKPFGNIQAQSTPATLADYWAGKAQWKFVRKWTLTSTQWSYGYGAEARIKIIGNTWYLFARKYYWNTPSPDYCKFDANYRLMGVEVRKSADRGQTWSDPVVNIAPQPNTAWECAATDGDVVYDAASNTWRYLLQCLDRTHWAGCYFTRIGSDPMGTFTPYAAGPVIESKALWGKICDLTTDKCSIYSGGPGKVYDEGTFDILPENDYYYIGFHGFDGKISYRGIAKTKDFVHFDAGNRSLGVPDDAVLSPREQSGWRETWSPATGPVGFGAGRLIKEGQYYYLASEAMDVSLLCIDGQKWDIGMFRSSDVSRSDWEKYPFGNPILYSSTMPERNGKSMACNPAYVEILKDPTDQKYYLHVTRMSMDPNYDGIYLYELATNSNLLKNGDLWKCTVENWSKISPAHNTTGLSVIRHPNKSSDGNCYIAAGCGGATCESGQSIYQDIPLSTVAPAAVSFGGKFAIDNGSAGTAKLALHQMDGTGKILATSWKDINAAGTYASFQSTALVNSQAKILRFELYLQSPGTIKADELFVEAASGLPGDTNGDHRVDIFDYNILVQNFGKTNCGNPADTDGNCKVDIFDYNILVQNFGKSQ